MTEDKKQPSVYLLQFDHSLMMWHFDAQMLVFHAMVTEHGRHSLYSTKKVNSPFFKTSVKTVPLTYRNSIEVWMAE